MAHFIDIEAFCTDCQRRATATITARGGGGAHLGQLQFRKRLDAGDIKCKVCDGIMMAVDDDQAEVYTAPEEAVDVPPATRDCL